MIPAKIADRSARVAVVGLGYVGLPTAVRFARTGFHTIGIDIRASVVNAVNDGRSPLPDVVPHSAVQGAVRAAHLEASVDAARVADADVILITVGTPVDEDLQPDLSQVRAATEAIAPHVQPGALVVLESTVHPGATRQVVAPLVPHALLAYCPERVVPGDPSKDVGMVDRVVGGATEEARQAALAVYEAVTDAEVHAVSSIEAAEAVKAYENTQRDVLIALGNEMALLCEKMGLDAYEVLRAAATKWNVMPVRPGAGVGGHCLPVDPWYLHREGEKRGYSTHLIPAARGVNDAMPGHVLDLVRREIPEGKIVCLGLSYKEGVADFRESPSLSFIQQARDAGYDVAVVDPHAGDDAPVAVTPLDEAIRDADALVLMTAHDEFLSMDWRAAKQSMRTPVIVDGRGVLDVPRLQRAGLRVVVLGRGDI